MTLLCDVRKSISPSSEKLIAFSKRSTRRRRKPPLSGSPSAKETQSLGWAGNFTTYFSLNHVWKPSLSAIRPVM